MSQITNIQTARDKRSGKAWMLQTVKTYQAALEAYCIVKGLDMNEISTRLLKEPALKTEVMKVVTALESAKIIDNP